MLLLASRATATEKVYDRHSIESWRPRLPTLLSPLMSRPFALRNRATDSGAAAGPAPPPPTIRTATSGRLETATGGTLVTATAPVTVAGGRLVTATLPVTGGSFDMDTGPFRSTNHGPPCWTVGEFTTFTSP